MLKATARFALVCLCFLQSDMAAADASPQVRKFVKDFYAWYLPKVERDTDPLTLIGLFKAHGNPIDDLLLAKLARDYEAQSRSPDDVVGIDYDPFLGGQDTCQGYTPERIRHDGKGLYRVVIFSRCWKTYSEDLTLLIYQKKSGEYKIRNVLYPEGGNLLLGLDDLQKEREKEARESKR
jgi:hypothetical protein